MSTVLLLSLWTAWLLVAFMLLGSWYGVTGALGFVILGIAFWAGTDMTWRSFLMGALVGYVLLAIAVLRADSHSEYRLSVAAAVSLAGLLWLWLDGGAAYWPYVVGIPLGGAAAAGLVYLYMRYRQAQSITTRTVKPPASSSPLAAAAPRRSSDQPGRSRSSTSFPSRGSEFLRARVNTPGKSDAPAKRSISGERDALDDSDAPAKPEVPDVPAATVSPIDRYPELRYSRWAPRGHGEADDCAGIKFDLLTTGIGAAVRLRPRIFPAAVYVDSPFSELLRVSGLARFFPAGTKHGRRSAAAVLGEWCELMDEDHHHIHRVSAPLTPLLEVGSLARQALVSLLSRPDYASAVTDFQHSLDACPHDSVLPTEIIRIVLVTDPQPTGTGVAGDYVAEESVLSVIDQLAGDAELVQLLVDVLNEPGHATGPARHRGSGRPGGVATGGPREEPEKRYARLLWRLLLAGHRDPEIALLPPDGSPPEGIDAIFGLFGSATVRRDRALLYRPASAGPDQWAALSTNV